MDVYGILALLFGRAGFAVGLYAVLAASRPAVGGGYYPSREQHPTPYKSLTCGELGVVRMVFFYFATTNLTAWLP